MLKNPGYVVLGLGHAKGVCVTQHLTPCWIMVAGHIRLGGQDLPQHAKSLVFYKCIVQSFIRATQGRPLRGITKLTRSEGACLRRYFLLLEGFLTLPLTGNPCSLRGYMIDFQKKHGFPFSRE